LRPGTVTDGERPATYVLPSWPTEIPWMISLAERPRRVVQLSAGVDAGRGTPSSAIVRADAPGLFLWSPSAAVTGTASKTVAAMRGHRFFDLMTHSLTTMIPSPRREACRVRYIPCLRAECLRARCL